MTLFNGVLLFDIAEPEINGWQNQTGYRGYMEVYKRGNEIITIEVNEDANPEGAFDKVVWEVWWANDDTGDWQPIGFGTFAECDNIAKEYMKTH